MIIKKALEEFLNTWETHSKPIIPGNVEKEFEAVLIRKNMNILNDSAKKLQAKIGVEAELPCNQALIALIQKLEGSYFSNALSFERGEPLFSSQEKNDSDDDDWNFL